MKESLKDRKAGQTHKSPAELLRSPAREAQAQDTWESSQPSRPSAVPLDSESEVEDPCVGFDFALVHPL